jgi:O-antigen/teichoic acid export membrane protein
MKSVKSNFLLLASHLSRFLSHPGVRRYGINTAWLFAEQILRLIAGFLVGVWVARYLGPEKFGLFSYALAFVSIFQGIAKLGLDGIVVRDLVQEPEKRDVYLGTSFWLKLIGGVTTFLIITIILFIQSVFTSNFFTETNIYILIIAFGIIFQSFEVIDFYYQATVQAKYISIRRIIQLILSSIIKIFLVLIGADLIWFVLVSLFDIISLSIMGWLIYRSQGLPNFVRYFDIEIGKKILKDSWPLLLSSIAIMIQARIDQIMLKQFIGLRELGNYVVALNITEALGFVPMILYQSLLPAIVEAKEKSNDIYYNRLLNYYRLMFSLFLIAFIILFFYGDVIIRFLYGSKYIIASQIISIIAFRNFFAYMGVARSAFITTENLFRYSLSTSIAGAISNTILNYILIQQFEIIGVILSSFISFFITIFLLDFFYSRTRINFILMMQAILTFYRIRLNREL